MMEASPIAVILVHMDSKGDRLLYRYPYQVNNTMVATQTVIETKKRNPYAANTTDELQAQQPPNVNNIYAATKGLVGNGFASGNNSVNVNGIPAGITVSPCGGGGQLQGCADEVLSALLAVKQQLCNQKFELKVNDVRFVSHPTLIQRKDQPQPQQQLQQQQTTQRQSNSIGGTVNNTPISQLIQVVSGTTNTANSTGTSSAAPVVATTSLINSNIQLPHENEGDVQSGLKNGQTVPLGAITVTGSTVTVSGISTSNATNKALPQQMLINIVFALHAQASYSIVKCYHELSKRLGLALKVEEQRIAYLSDETMQMARTHDEISTQQLPVERAFDLITERCSLAQALKAIYHDLCSTGLLSTTLNQNLTLSFCLPQKAHQLHKKGSMVDLETIDHCLRSLKPYHGMLLLVDFAELFDCVPPTGARMLLQLIEVYTPLMSLQSMASDADLNLEHVYKLVSHLVYWAKATIIYPLCETNVYVIAPDALLHTKSHLVEKFSTRFAGMSLFEVIADFSLPTSIGHLTTPLQQPARQGILAQMVLWMLQHHLLVQLHTYVQFMPSDMDDMDQTELTTSIQASKAPAEGNRVGETRTVSAITTEDLLELHEAALNGADDISEIRVDSANSIRCLNHDLSDDELNAASLLSMSSQPLPVPHTSRRSITEDRYSAGGSTASDNIAAQPSSSHKSNFSMTASLSTENCDSIASIEDEEKMKELLQVFDEPARAAIRHIPASTQVDDLSLMVKLYQAGYFKSEHHLEEIMYFENLRRSQLLQLLDKFRDVLIIYETGDPAIASMYNNK